MEHGKNVIILVIDELAYTRMGDIFKNSNSASPFLDKLKANGFSAENMYAQAPYTEGAVRGLLGGRNVMDELGTLLNNFNLSSTAFNELEKQNYDVFTLGMDYGDNGKNIKELKNSQLLAEYNYNAIWNYRLKNFSKLFDKNELKVRDYDVIETILDNYYKQYCVFYKLLLTNSSRVGFVREHFIIPDESQLKKEYRIYLDEIKRLKSDKVQYINRLFQEKENYFLKNVSKWNKVSMIQDEAVKIAINKRWKQLYKKIRKISFKKNLKNIKINWWDIKAVFIECFHGEVSKGFRHFKLILLNYFDLLRERMMKKKIEYEGEPYCRLDDEFSYFRQWYLNRKTEKNFFAYLHVIDMHATAKMIHLSNDINEIERQTNLISDFVDKLSDDYKGSLNNDCALRMADDTLEIMFKQMEKDGILDDTYVVITSDHGCSYTYCPPRNDMVNVFFAEQYHVPFIIYGKDLKTKVYRELCETKSIMPTIFSLIGLAKPDYFVGKNLLNDSSKHNIVLHEYMGGGCPDFYHRPILFCARSEEWKVCFNVMLSQDFEEGKMTEIHDLVRDPYELNNLIYNKNFDKTLLEDVMQYMRSRFQEIQKNYNKLVQGYKQ